MIKYHFDKKIILGEIIYRINVAAPFEMLYDLSSGFLQRAEGVKEVIDGIQKVGNNEVEIYSFGGSDYCIVDVRKEYSSVQYDFGENEIQVPTAELLNLLNDWLRFLKENNS